MVGWALKINYLSIYVPVSESLTKDQPSFKSTCLMFMTIGLVLYETERSHWILVFITYTISITISITVNKKYYYSISIRLTHDLRKSPIT